MSVVVRLRYAKRIGVDRPRWCSPTHCRAGELAQANGFDQTIPLRVGGAPDLVRAPLDLFFQV